MGNGAGVDIGIDVVISLDNSFGDTWGSCVGVVVSLNISVGVGYSSCGVGGVICVGWVILSALSSLSNSNVFTHATIILHNSLSDLAM